MERPFLKFFVTDWDNDESLGDCSMAAQGWWLRMLIAMHQATPYGHFLRPNGSEINLETFARKRGQRLLDVQKWMAELDKNGVFSRGSAGVIFSRKLVRSEARAVKNRQNAKKGGNPHLTSSQQSTAQLLEIVTGLRNEIDALHSDNQNKNNRITESDNPNKKSGITGSDISIESQSPESRVQSPDARGQTSAPRADEANALSDFVLDVGIEHDVVGEHHALDRAQWRHRNRESAVKLVAAYGLAECKSRALRLFEAIESGKFTNRHASVMVLESKWDYREMQPPKGIEPSAALQQYLDAQAEGAA